MDRLLRETRLQAIAFCGAVFVAWAGASLLWSKTVPVYPALYLTALIGAFLAGRILSPSGLRLSWIVLLGIYTCALPFYSFLGPNALGAVSAVAFGAALAFELWLFVPVAVLGLALSMSRGAILAAGIVSIAALWRQSRFAAYLAFLCLIAITFGLKNDLDSSLFTRLGLWQDTLNHLTLFGHGFGSFYDTNRGFEVHTNFTLAMPVHAYNDYLELISDLGIGAIPLWVLIALSIDGVRYREGLILLAFAVLSLSFFPFYIPILGQLFALTLGQASKGEPYGSMASSCPPLSEHRRYKVGVL